MDAIKHLVVRTPLEGPAHWLARMLKVRLRCRHPELRELHAEDRHIRRFIDRALSADSNCVDVGSHIGSMLSRFLRFAPRGVHHAFEPSPEKALRLRRKFPEVAVHAIALSDRGGEAEFFMFERRSGLNSLRRPAAAHGGAVTQCTVPLARLDDVVPPSGYRADFIKLDVEGGELLVLRGARLTLALHRPIVLFECTCEGLAAFGLEAREVFDFLHESHGYDIYLPADAAGGGPPLAFEEFARAQVYPFRAYNFIAMVRQRRR
jgi:FkbM family methyltransferase